VLEVGDPQMFKKDCLTALFGLCEFIEAVSRANDHV